MNQPCSSRTLHGAGFDSYGMAQSVNNFHMHLCMYYISWFWYLHPKSNLSQNKETLAENVFVSSYLKMTAICITLYCSWYQRKSVLSNWGKIFTLIFLNWCYLQDKEAMCKINSPRLSRSHPGPSFTILSTKIFVGKHWHEVCRLEKKAEENVYFQINV